MLGGYFFSITAEHDAGYRDNPLLTQPIQNLLFRVITEVIFGDHRPHCVQRAAGSKMKYKFRSVVLCFLFSTSTRRSPVAIFFAFKLSSRILSRTLWTRNRDSLEKDLSDSEYHQKSRELATV